MNRLQELLYKGDEGNGPRQKQKNLQQVWGKEAERVMKQVEAKKKRHKRSWRILLWCIVQIALYICGGWAFFGTRIWVDVHRLLLFCDGNSFYCRLWRSHAQ
jgi:hypothetical protein